MSRVTARIDIDGKMCFRFPYDSWTIQTLKVRIPAWGRSYDSFVKEWSIDYDFERIAIDLLQRTFGEFPIPKREKNIPTEQPARSTDSYAVLHLLPTAPTELIAGAYKILSKLNHPDLGGNATTMQQINIAYANLRETAMTG